ncbi:uncharacterized protein LOC101889778 isoform X1 [Musca domestica]|uniref:Dystroglycan 1 n=1 Tax=Musca domestica TaxID=7370 RepID=A0ABM3UQU7_MUSDO|nr:uncharacterized protein LOC101889778 isoform X1 [Musca domestica]XP_058975902.1 uncharacterized protein LOC101889778 isoform X1 [Musca domestica]XP_058975903.1 uncharacterized protein LOC101889778 isoform X1 [Musca domestica]XP_058975904.1 uncharacterized protein LOC101889778 isoform X1 [Musca domestica]XP_058975905.1 uncharacterized protein LOC101889778 isoform X1 [Musca domestica]
MVAKLNSRLATTFSDATELDNNCHNSHSCDCISSSRTRTRTRKLSMMASTTTQTMTSATSPYSSSSPSSAAAAPSSRTTRRWCNITSTTTHPLVLYSFVLLLVLHPVISNAERDFNFNDSQIPLIEPKDEPTLIEGHHHHHANAASSHHNHHQHKSMSSSSSSSSSSHHHHQHQDPYAVELSHCRYGDNELVLSLVLQNYNWHDLNESRRSKVLDKLSKFFAIPKEFITMESVTKHDLFEMQKESVKKGNNKCHTNNNRKLGRVDFIIGCRSTYFTITEPIVKQIEQQFKEGALDNITGEKFGWWLIWRKHYKNATRKRRQVEGSGDAEDDDEYEDYDYDGDDTIDETQHNAVDSSSSTTTTSQNSYAANDNNNNNKVEEDEDDEPELTSNTLEVAGTSNRDDITALKQTDSETTDNNINENKEMKKITIDDEEIDESVSKLESVITKTIENTKHIEDIPEIVVEQPEDVLLKQVLQPESEKSENIELNNIYENPREEDNEFSVAEVMGSLTPQTSTNVYGNQEEGVTSPRSPTSSISNTNNNHNHDNQAENNLDLTHHRHNHHQQNAEHHQHNHGGGELTSTTSLTTTLMTPPPPVILFDSTTQTITIASNDIPPPNDTSAFSSSSSSAATTTGGSTTTNPTTTTIGNISVKQPNKSNKMIKVDVNKYDDDDLDDDEDDEDSDDEDEDIDINEDVAEELAKHFGLMEQFNSLTANKSRQHVSHMGHHLAAELDHSRGAVTTQTVSSYAGDYENKDNRQQFTLHPYYNSNLLTTTTPPSPTTTLSTPTTTTTITIKPIFISTTTTTPSTDTNEQRHELENNSNNVVVFTGKKDVYYDTTLKPEEEQELSSSKSASSTTPAEDSIFFASSTNPPSQTTTQTSSSPSLSTTPELPSTTSAIPEDIEPIVENTPPMIKSRLQKLAVTSGKSFKFAIPEDTFYDAEDMTNLRLELTDKEGRELKSNSWLQFNAETKEVYGLPLDDSVSKWQYRLTATDSGNESVVETFEISVQQHRGVRTVNHEVNIAVKINEKNMHYIDWQMKLIKAIATTLGDENTSSIVVREIRANSQDPSIATLVYLNETLPTSECPETELNNLVKRLDANRLSDLVYPTLGIKSITGQLIGPCQKSVAKAKAPTISVKNSPPVPRNQVDRVVATAGHLLVYKVPSDTFFDDGKITLSLKTKDHKELSPTHWLQFDSKNEEFYGIPKAADVGSEEYMLEAEDTAGLTATDALVVLVNPAPKKEFSVYYKAFLGVKHENFHADLQRKFVERIAQLFGDASAQNIQIRSVNPIHDTDSTAISFYNTTLYRSHNRCPEEEIESVRSVYQQDGAMRDRVRKILGSELNITNIQIYPLACNDQTNVIHREYVPTKTDEPLLKSTFSDDYLYTIILPAIIIVTMILIASIIACCLHRRRRKSGKMELGDEEERKSFRTKGIPVIFQDELDEKPEIGNKSPIILKNEKPPLLPPSYNTSNMNGDNDCDEYVPPPAVVVGGREARGKSPATPSYRKPPPYVSP